MRDTGDGKLQDLGLGLAESNSEYRVEKCKGKRGLKKQLGKGEERKTQATYKRVKK